MLQHWILKSRNFNFYPCGEVSFLADKQELTWAPSPRFDPEVENFPQNSGLEDQGSFTLTDPSLRKKFKNGSAEEAGFPLYLGRVKLQLEDGLDLAPVAPPSHRPEHPAREYSGEYQWEIIVVSDHMDPVTVTQWLELAHRTDQSDRWRRGERERERESDGWMGVNVNLSSGSDGCSSLPYLLRMVCCCVLWLL